MIPDPDPQEIIEWREAFEAAVRSQGRGRGAVLLDELVAVAQKLGLQWRGGLSSPYVNTVRVEDEPAFPGDVAIEDRLGSLMRWNALAMVARANLAYGELGGHIASYASAADLFEVGFNHFFRAPNASRDGDLVFFQPHSAPGVYARAYLEGRLDAEDLAHYRQELEGKAKGVRGLTSPISGSSPRAPWAWGRSPRSTRRASCATSRIGGSSIPPGGACGASSAMARWTSRRA